MVRWFSSNRLGALLRAVPLILSMATVVLVDEARTWIRQAAIFFQASAWNWRPVRQRCPITVAPCRLQ